MAATCVTTATSIGAASLLEARRTVHGLFGARLEGHAGDVAAARADRLVHLAWRAGCSAVVPTGRIRAPLSLGAPRLAAIRATGRLAEPAARIEVLLAARESKCLPAIAAGQRHIARHLVRRLPWFSETVQIDHAHTGRGAITEVRVVRVPSTRLKRYGRGTAPAEAVYRLPRRRCHTSFFELGSDRNALLRRFAAHNRLQMVHAVDLARLRSPQQVVAHRTSVGVASAPLAARCAEQILVIHSAYRITPTQSPVHRVARVGRLRHMA
jgi:hypothetical protein